MHPTDKLARRIERRIKGMRPLRQDRAQHAGWETHCACLGDEAGQGRGRAFARFADYPQVCSCPMCGNRRRWWGERTVQELRHE